MNTATTLFKKFISSTAIVSQVALAPAAVMTFGFGPSEVHAQVANYRFNQIKVEGNRRIEASSIISYTNIGRGERISAAKLNTAYQNILNTGLFEKVEIIPRGSLLVIRVVEYPTVNVVNFEGNQRVKDEVLAGLVQIKSRHVYNPNTVDADIDAISKAYAQEGRLAARVQSRIIKRSENRVDVIFEIFEGGNIETQRVGFVGNKAYSDYRLRRVVDSKQAGILRALIRRDTFVEDRIEFDKQLLRDFYLSRGYVDFRVNSANAELSQERDGYFLTFNIREGQQFRLGEITASSEIAEIDIERYQSKLKSREGKIYSPTLIENDISRLEKLALRDGHDFVRVEPRITRNDHDLTLDIDFVLSRGQRVFVERIDIEGNTATLDRVIRRQFRSAEGDPFNPREIRESAERIRALGFFNSSNVNAREGSSAEQVIIDVDVEEKPTGTLSFGATYSSSSGPGATVSYSESNFLGRGQALDLSVTTGTDFQKYDFNFSEPSFLHDDLRFDLGLSYIETDNQNAVYDTAIGQFRPSLTFPLSEVTRMSVRYTADYSELLNLDTTTIGTDRVIRNEFDRGKIWKSSVGYTLSYDTARSRLNPNTRVLLQFDQDFGGLGTDEQYIKTTAKAIAQTKVLQEQVTLRATVEGGMLKYQNGGSRVTDRFFMGQSKLRGFEFGGVGPRQYVAGDDGYDDTLGGDMYAVARFEAEFPLGLPEEYGIRGGVFYDVGSLWSLDTNLGNILYDDFSLRKVIGASVLWDTQIGPLRFNFTKALEKETYDREETFEFTIQTKF